MSKTIQDREDLTKLLDGVQVHKSKLSIDEPEKEILKQDVIKPIPTKKFCGMKIPVEIYNICQYIIKLLKTQNKYTAMMDLQIYNCAVQQWIYNNLISNQIKGDFVHTRELTTTSEALRRSLQALGLTVSDKKAGIESTDDVSNNPLAQFLENMNSDDEHQQPILKKKKKSV